LDDTGERERHVDAAVSPAITGPMLFRHRRRITPIRDSWFMVDAVRHRSAWTRGSWLAVPSFRSATLASDVSKPFCICAAAANDPLSQAGT